MPGNYPPWRSPPAPLSMTILMKMNRALFGLVRFAQTLRLKQALVDAVQALFLGLRDQRVVLDIEQVIDDEPNRLVGRHPVLRVEALQIDWNGVAAQRALAPQVKVDVEVAERQFAQRAVDGLAPAASGVIRFGHCAPAASLAVNGNHVVGIMIGFEVEQQRRISVDPQR